MMNTTTTTEAASRRISKVVPKPQQKQKEQKPPRVRPTHFLAIPLNTSHLLRTRIAAFQKHLLSTPSKASLQRSSNNPECEIKGLHSSIVIKPERFHLTLGVMALADDTVTLPPSSSSQPSKKQKTETTPKHTVSGALALLRSLKPQLDALLEGAGPGDKPATSPPSIPVFLECMDIMRRVKRPQLPSSGPTPAGSARLENEIWADVMYLAPRESGGDGVKLRRVCDLVHTTFKQAGYVVETRPLKLHCTILNTSHRKPPKRGVPFCYSDILRSDAMKMIADGRAVERITAHGERGEAGAKSIPPRAVPLNGVKKRWLESGGGGEDEGAWTTVDVREVGLWVMGSHAEDGAYVSVGGVQIGSGRPVSGVEVKVGDVVSASA